LAVFGLIAVSQTAQAIEPHLTKQTAMQLGLAALKTRYPSIYDKLVAEHGPFIAEFRDGIWLVSGTRPKGILGGGAPVVELRDSDSQVLRIHFNR
jgi:hypothetical protein